MSQPLVQCECGTVLVTCRCPLPHEVRLIPACGVCTATGGEVDLAALEVAPLLHLEETPDA